MLRGEQFKPKFTNEMFYRENIWIDYSFSQPYLIAQDRQIWRRFSKVKSGTTES